MEDPNSTLLPYILESLSRKPELCDTFDNLCKDVEAQLAMEENTKYGNIRKALQRALSVGQSLGIITLTNETIRVPFNFRPNKNAKRPANASSSKVPQPAIGTGNPPATSEKNQKNTRKGMNSCSHTDEEDDAEYMIVPSSTRHRPVRMAARSQARSRSGPRRRSRRGRPRSGYVRHNRTKRRR